MNINNINKKLNKLYNKKVSARLEKNVLFLEGHLDNYDDVLKAGLMCVNKEKWNVVNNITFNHEEEQIRKPVLKDKFLDNKEYDVVVIGAGISGCSIARELSKYKMKVLVVEKENDIAMQTSSRNDGEIHPGVDLNPKLKKYQYLMKANPMYEKLCADLGVKFNRCGQYVLFDQGWAKPIIRIVCKIKTNNGCPTRFATRKEILEKLPYVNPKVKFGLFNETAGVISPYKFAIAYAENANKNGVEFSFNTIVNDFVLDNKTIVGVKTNRGVVKTKLVISAAGVFAEEIAKLANDQFFSIHPRKGTELIMDKKLSYMTNYVFATKHLGGSSGHTKGGGIMKTIDNNILVGPDAIETYLKEDYSTNMDSINGIIAKHSKSSELIKKNSVITYFSGIRCPTYEEDFCIEKGRNCPNIIHVAGIQSPGLTTAPAVALEVADMAASMLNITELNKNYNPKNDKKIVLNDLSLEERNAAIKKNPNYGIMVCRCEEISKGEIIDSLANPLTPSTIDAIKRRVRPGMGRCQGSFCQGVVAKIISQERHILLEQVTKNTEQSYISYGSNKGGK